MADPDIYRFTDFREYLKSLVIARDWSMADLGKAGRCTRGHAGNVLHAGRRLNSPILEHMASGLGLDAEAQRFFIALVAFTEGVSGRERDEAWRKMLVHKRFHDAHRITASTYRYLAHWYIPTIREMCVSQRLRNDPDRIAALLWPSVPARDVRAAVGVLLELGLVEAGADGYLRPRDTGLVTHDQVDKLAVRNFYREMFVLADRAIDDVDTAERQYGAVIQAVPTVLLAEVRAEVEQCRKRVQALCDEQLASQPGAPSRVYLLALQLFPVTRS